MTCTVNAAQNGQSSERTAFVHRILPAARIVTECAAFDVQKLKNPGKQVQNISRAVRRDSEMHVSMCCSGTVTSVSIAKGGCTASCASSGEQKDRGDSRAKLITLCEDCLAKHHSLSAEQQAVWNLPSCAIDRDAAFMGIMRRTVHGALKDQYAGVSVTYGCIAKDTRSRLVFEKPHVRNAYCTAWNPEAKPSGDVLAT